MQHGFIINPKVPITISESTSHSPTYRSRDSKLKTLILQLWICYTLFYAAVQKFIFSQSCSSDQSAKSSWEHAWI